MLSPDMMGQGGPPPDMDQPPPELMAQLMGGGGMPPGGMGQQGPPPPPSQGAESVVDHLRQSIEHAQAALQMEPDDTDSQSLTMVLKGLYQILANRQKEQEQLLGGGNIRALSRAQG